MRQRILWKIEVQIDYEKSFRSEMGEVNVITATCSISKERGSELIREGGFVGM